MESPFMWPGLNKALYCGSGEVAVQSNTKWTSLFGSSAKNLCCLYSDCEGGKVILQTQETCPGSLEENHFQL